jgi:hypothetical protein
MMKKQLKGPGFWAHFFAFAAVYFSMDTLQFGTNKEEIFSTILYVSVPVLVVLAFAYGWWENKQLHVKALFVTVVMCILVVCTHFASEQELNMKYFFLCMVYLLAFFICTVIPVEDFKRAFVNVLSVLAAVSVFGFCLRYVYPGIVNHLPVLTNTADFKYGNLILTVIPHDVIYVPFRNYGIFREPGVYQFFLNLALIFLMEKPEFAKSWKFYVIMLAMVFTFSTAGYILCFAILLVYFLLDRVEIRIGTVVPVVLGVLGVGFLFSRGIIKVDSNVFSKLFTSNASTNSRFGSIAVDFYIALMNPVFGSGFEFVENNFAAIALDEFRLSQMHNTNTIMKMLAVHGFLLPPLFLTGIALFCRKFLARRGWTLFFLLFAGLLSASDLIFNTTIYIFMIYGFFDTDQTEAVNESAAD